MNKVEFRAAYRQARLVYGFKFDTGVALPSLTASIDPRVRLCALRAGSIDYLSLNYNGGRCGRRTPRTRGMRRPRLPA